LEIRHRSVRPISAKHAQASRFLQQSLITGERNGISVLDVDLKNGNDGLLSLATLGFDDHRAMSPVRTITPSGGRHLFFAYKADLKARVGKIGPGLDVRNNGGFVIAPGSIKNGERYIVDGQQLARGMPLPEWPDTLTPPAQPERDPVPIREASEFHRQWARGHLTKLAAKVEATLVGTRQAELNNVSMWAGGAGAHGALSREGAGAVLIEAGMACGLSEREARSTFNHGWDDGLRKPIELPNEICILDDDFDASTGDAPEAGRDNSVIDLNRDHAAVMMGGKFRIIVEKESDYDLFTDTELHKMNANRRVKVEGTNRTEPVTAAWMRHPQRREYRGGLVFNPKFTPSGAYNIWRGWAVQPSSVASCELFLTHLRDVICDGSEREYLWLLGWMAHLVQHPAQKPGTAVVLRGMKGAGKDTVGHYLGTLLPRHHVTLSQPEHLTGRFNAHMETAILIQLEEGYWAGDHRAEGVLKNLITCQSLEVERKGIDPYKIDHFGRLLITSNAEWVVPATPGERRFFVLDVSPAHAKDTSYFGAIWEEHKNGGAGALLHFLQSYDLTGFDVRNPPETAGLTQQKLEGLRNLEAWWRDRLSEGDLRQGGGDGFDDDHDAWDREAITISRDYLRRNYEEWLSARRWHGNAVSVDVFGKRLRAICTGLEDKRGSVSGQRVRQYVLPPLAKCRASFAAHMGGEIEWDQ
ncbi:DUF5906 domain-containing protein, partial [uncultured Paracoccus sp.]|uniref:DUF5906 domain-containing protein n=1 Tax=uncultured Paracoccus sp. TaxID=189685 RepID=UPI00262DB237